jgi:NAD(P)-dependent dehydrogenase (short-subunit alcohol dehydrogenase family)
VNTVVAGNDKRLVGKTALITGAGSGLGAETARVLAGAGSNVVVADLNAHSAERVVATLSDCPGEALALALDVRDAKSATAAFEATVEQFGSLEILINNAGVDRTVPFDELSVEEWDAVLGVNLRGAFVMSRLAFPHMKERGHGHIVNIVSTASRRTWANAAAYHASKWGLLGLSHALHVEARTVGIGVTALIAGGMRTPFIMNRFPDTDPEVLQEPRNVADAIRFVLEQPPGTVIPELMVLPMRETSWP